MFMHTLQEKPSGNPQSYYSETSNTDIYYAINENGNAAEDNDFSDVQYKKYEKPFKVSKDCVITAYAVSDTTNQSKLETLEMKFKNGSEPETVKLAKLDFAKTSFVYIIPVKEMCPFGNPVARSQARRILRRLEEFQEIIFDFRDVEILGQGFADEVFRVFQNKYPEIVLTVQNANKSVQGMIRHVSGGRNKIYPL